MLSNFNQKFSNSTNGNETYHESNYEDGFCKGNFILMLTGLLCNIICICVFLHKKNIIRKFNWYLLVLAVFELIFCLTQSVDHLHRLITIPPTFLHAINLRINITIDFIIHSSDSYATILTLLLSIDRLYAIKNPLKIRKFVTSLHAKCLMSTCFISVLILKIIYFGLCTDKKINKDFQMVYCLVLSPVIFNIIPMVVIFVLNVLLLKEMIDHGREKKARISSLARQSLTNMICLSELNKSSQLDAVQCRVFNKKEISKTQKAHYLIIIASAAWTVFTAFPFFTLNAYTIACQFEVFQIISNFETIDLAQDILSILFNSNHCINFFIYFVFYEDFRTCIIKFRLSSKTINLNNSPLW